MASFRGRGAATNKHLRVLLQFTSDTLRIPEDLADEIGAGEALVVGFPGSGKEVWPVKVGKDGDGAFLGRGWPEFADGCGVEDGWFLVIRHHGRGVLTVKVFDSSSCLREPGAPPAVEVAPGSKGSPRKPQFVVFPLKSLEEMLIPAKFVQHYIPKEHLNSYMTVIVRPPGKIGQIELRMNQSDLFLTGGWSQFLASHGITGANALLLRYEGSMVFTIKVFEPDGCQRGSRNRDIRMQQDMEEQHEAPSACTLMCCKNRENKLKGPMTGLERASLLIKSVYEIGPPSWIKKQINANTLTELALATSFCDAIGLREPCTISLKTSMNSTESWQVCGHPRKNKSYMLVQGWKRFCKDNNLMEGDICTFNVLETTLWHVAITRYKEKRNQLFYETISASSLKRKSKNHSLCAEEQKRPKGPMASLNKASSMTTCAFEVEPQDWIKKGINASSIEKQQFESLSPSNCKHKSKINRLSSEEQQRQKGNKTSSNKASTITRCVYEIGPPAWIKKKMNASTIQRQLSLPLSFCKVIGLQELCTIMLKTSMSTTTCWPVNLHPYQNCCQLFGSGWTKFCYENGIGDGDVCTFKIIETTLWHVIIERREAKTS